MQEGAKMRKLTAILICGLCVVVLDAQQTGEYLWGKEKSRAFIVGTNAEDIFKLWFAAKTRFALNEYIVGEDGKKRTYVDDILVIESQHRNDTTHQFGFKFASVGDAFNFYQDVKNQMSLFVPIRNDNNTFAAFFADGSIVLNLSGTNVFVLIGLSTS
jgi:hypothetical protein